MFSHINWGFNNLEIPYVKKEFNVSGQGIKICIIDSGLANEYILSNNKFQEPFSENIIDTRDFVENGGQGPITYDSSPTNHGTEILGLIGAAFNDPTKDGIADKAKFYIAKITNNNDESQQNVLEAAIEWAVFEKEVDIIHISQQFGDCSKAWHTAIRSAIEKGIFVVCSAGNAGTDIIDNIKYPAAYQETLCVGGFTKENDSRTLQVLNNNSKGILTDFVAPGDGMMSALSTAGLDMTSFAAPFVTGIIALFLSADIPDEEIKEKLQSKTIDRFSFVKNELIKAIDSEPGIPTFKKFVSPRYGHGVIEVKALFEMHFMEKLYLSLEPTHLEENMKLLTDFTQSNFNKKPETLVLSKSNFQ